METADGEKRNFLTRSEIAALLKAAKRGRHGERDYYMLLAAYRHGYRVTELVTARLADLDLGSGRIYVRRSKGSLSTQHPMEGDEMRAARAWLRRREEMPAADSPYLFLGERGPLTRQAVNYILTATAKRAGVEIRVHPHILRHSCGYELANRGLDTRLVQDWLGHANIHHTVRYTRTAAARFQGIWG